MVQALGLFPISQGTGFLLAKSVKGITLNKQHDAETNF
jgi:hypothetical protein